MKAKAFIYVIAAGVLWGSSGIFVHYLSPLGFTPVQLSGVRAFVSALVMALFILFSDRSLFKISRTTLLLSALVGISLYSTASFYYTSMTLTSVSTSVVLMYTSPIYVTLVSAAFFGEKLSKMKFTALAMIILGCVFVSGLVSGLALDGFGIFMGLMAGVTFASYNILTKLTLKKNVSPLSVSFYSFLTATLMSMILSDPVGTVRLAWENPLPSLPLLLGIGVCTFVLPYFLMTLSLGTLDAGTVSSLAIVEPMSATLFSVILFSEELDVFKILGVVLIVGAVLLLGLIENRAADGKKCSHKKEAEKSKIELTENRYFKV